MKRLLWLLPMFLSLCGCSVFAANSPYTEPVQPAVVEMSPPVVILPPISNETAPSAIAEDTMEETRPATSEQTEEPSTEPQLAQTEPPAAVTDSPTSTPASTTPTEPSPTVTTAPPTEPPVPLIRYQHGDTTPTWSPELAENYPQDGDCDANMLLEKWMAVEGLRMADLDTRNCRQLILASAQPPEGGTTLTVCYERGADGSFHPVPGLEGLQGFVGKSGIMHDRRRNTNTSPCGPLGHRDGLRKRAAAGGAEAALAAGDAQLRLGLRRSVALLQYLAGTGRSESDPLGRRRGAPGGLPDSVRLGLRDRVQPPARRGPGLGLRDLPSLCQNRHRRLRRPAPRRYVFCAAMAGC